MNIINITYVNKYICIYLYVLECIKLIYLLLFSVLFYYLFVLINKQFKI